MKRILLLAVVALLLNGCRYINPKHPHLDAKESELLEIPEGLDKPDTTSELDVPKAKDTNSVGFIEQVPPPQMPIRTRQSKKGDVRIENVEGYPELSVKTEVEYMWEAIKSLNVENWAITNKNKDACQMTLDYTDADAEERENANFIKKLFTRKDFYTDFSGKYQLTCKQEGSLVKTKFAKIDGSKAQSHLADNVMNALFKKFE